mgnify:FL=1
MFRFLLFFLFSSCVLIPKKKPSESLTIKKDISKKSYVNSEQNIYKFSRKDSLRGFLFPERSCFDVQRYDLYVSVFPDKKFIKGYNDINFNVVHNTDKIQLDLYDNMNIDRVCYINKEKDVNKVIHSLDSIAYFNKKIDSGEHVRRHPLTTFENYYREFNSFFVSFKEPLIEGTNHTLRVYYSGVPIEAKRPPWDGGFSWDKDDNGQDWVAVSCQGIGASLWWPNKDHQSDEPDQGMTISVETPDNLIAISNGNLKNTNFIDTNQRKVYVWDVTYPINNYNVTLNIGDYIDFYDSYHSVLDSFELDLSYYVMSYNLYKAKEHFQIVKPMLSCFENYFGEYPFRNDGYSLVETPYLGMEHQSAIAYGNNYLFGYNGNTNFTAGLDFDYIIIHETGHEWWGNSVTSNDIADMWIHEGFCTYSEVVFVECYYGYEEMLKYVAKQRESIRNRKPIQGVYGVHNQAGGDMYSKFSFVLHTLRSVMDNDDKFFELIRNIYQQFKYQNIDGKDVIEYIKKFIDNMSADLGPRYGNMNLFFKQYLERSEIPLFEYKFDNNKFVYRWNAIKGFNMPVQILINNHQKWIYPSSEWKKIKISKGDSLSVLEEKFLINVKKFN